MENNKDMVPPQGGGALGRGPATEPVPAFRIGERIAVPYLPILRIENNVAVLKKTRMSIGAECGARHKVRIETPFYIRGGFRVDKKTMYRIPGWAFEVVFKTPYGTVARERVPQRNMYVDTVGDIRQLAEQIAREVFGDRVAEIVSVEVREQPKAVDVYVRRFKHAEVIIPPDDYFIEIRKDYQGDTYFNYEFVAETEAKLVDDVSRIDYVLMLFGHRLESRSACATIKLLRGDVVWGDFKNTCCKIESSAAGMAVARYGGRVVVAYNNAQYRGPEKWVIEEWEVSAPPKLIHRYETSEPVATELHPDDVT
jgi:hypothetical protein